MNVALIDASFYHQGRLLKFRRVGYFPLTLARIAAYFPEGTRIRLIHEKCQDVPLGERFDLVFFTTMGSNLARAKELSAVFRKSGAKTVVGGHSVQPLLGYCRESFDAVVIGDAEGLIPRICEDAAQGKLSPLYENLSPAIETLPPPRYDLIPPEIVGDIMPIETSRGCPNICDFCGVTSLYSAGFRKRNPEEVLREIELAKRFLSGRLSTRIRTLIYFTDPNFSADLKHSKTILRGLIGKDVLWLASADIRALQDDEFLKLARESGCFCLQIGLESLSQMELEKAHKHFAAHADYQTLIKRSQNAGVPVLPLMMFGFDSDTRSTFRRTQTFLERMHIPLVVAHIILPIPGTPLHKTWQTEGRLLPFDLSRADGLQVLFRPRNFTPDELSRTYWQFSNRLLSLRSIVKRFLWTGVFKNPLAYLVLLITNFMARSVVAHQLPPGTYE